MTTDLRPSIDAPWNAFAVPATVTPLGGLPIETRVVEEPIQDLPRLSGTDLGVADLRPRVALRRDDVIELPEGSTITAKINGRDGDWIVDRIEQIDAEVFYAVVSEAPA